MSDRRSDAKGAAHPVHFFKKFLLGAFRQFLQVFGQKEVFIDVRLVFFGEILPLNALQFLHHVPFRFNQVVEFKHQVQQQISNGTRILFAVEGAFQHFAEGAADGFLDKFVLGFFFQERNFLQVIGLNCL